MFSGLKKRWNVDGWRVLVILLCFAVAGSATGYLGRIIMDLLQIKAAWLYIIIYVVVVTITWPVMVALVSVIFGQYRFFSGYLRRMRERMFGKKKMEGMVDQGNFPGSADPGKKIHLAIFASGTGSNARKIIDHFRHHPNIQVSLIVSNTSAAGVLSVAQQENIPTLIIEKEKFFRDNAYVDELREKKIDLIVLAGFLWKLPSKLVSAWNRRIINIHPALLPKYGGKGLYGHHVHEAVIRAGEKESGITIHYVDELYDHGEAIYQEKVLVEPTDTPETLAKKIQALEHLHFPKVIEQAVHSIWK